MTGGFPMARTWNNRQLVHFAGRIPPFSVRPSVRGWNGPAKTKLRCNPIRKLFVLNPQSWRRTGAEGGGAETRDDDDGDAMLSTCICKLIICALFLVNYALPSWGTILNCIPAVDCAILINMLRHFNKLFHSNSIHCAAEM